VAGRCANRSQARRASSARDTPSTLSGVRRTTIGRRTSASSRRTSRPSRASRVVPAGTARLRYRSARWSCPGCDARGRRCRRPAPPRPTTGAHRTGQGQGATRRCRRVIGRGRRRERPRTGS
jgi:hypothetical protein